MNKKLIAVAVAAAVGAPMAASAEATIYGSVHIATTSVDKENNGPTGTDFSDGKSVEFDGWTQEIRDGQVGIQGSEDLGNGLKALYKVEYNITSYDDATQTTADMADLDEVWLGISGDFGTVLFGQEDTPYKTFMDSAGVDILGDSIVDVDTMLKTVGAAGFERFTGSGVIAYVSPNFSGFTFGAAVITGGQSGESDSTTITVDSVGTGTVTGTPPAVSGTISVIDVGKENDNDGFAEHYSIGANYVAGGLKIAGGFESKAQLVECAGCKEEDEEQWGIGASYTFGAFQVAAKYEDMENVGAASSTKTKNSLFDAKRYAVSGKYTMGNIGLGAVYSAEDQEANGSGANGGEDIDYDGWGLFGEYNFSNRTKVYAAYSSVEADNDSSDAKELESDRFSLGIIHNF